MDKNLEDIIVEILSERKMTITTVESCTGGLLMGRIINSSGASACVNEGYITYSNEAKHRLVGVSNDTLNKYGAVSEETAREMAVGGAKAANSNVALAITGIAGPLGGTALKPVGLVYVGCYVDGKVIVKKCQFSGNRMEVRNQTVETALRLLYECIC